MTKLVLASTFIALSLLTSAIYAVNDKTPPGRAAPYYIVGHGMPLKITPPADDPK